MRYVATALLALYFLVGFSISIPAWLVALIVG
jgi:hypothetical protein